SCGGVAGGAGGTVFSATGATIAAGATNGLTITLPVAFSSSATATLVNTVTATDPDSASVASASDSDVPSARLATAVPVDARWALVLLAVVLLLAAQRALRARPPRVGRR
ncbi:MAG: hypothetical protein ACREX7_03090, partial [Casimicrobiaceae bacterium]